MAVSMERPAICGMTTGLLSRTLMFMLVRRGTYGRTSESAAMTATHFGIASAISDSIRSAQGLTAMPYRSKVNSNLRMYRLRFLRLRRLIFHRECWWKAGSQTCLVARGRFLSVHLSNFAAYICSLCEIYRAEG